MGSEKAAAIAHFFCSLKLTTPLPDGFDVLNPYTSEDVVRTVEEFCSTYYAKNTTRVPIWGINPGRFGAGVTGIAFTDPQTLRSTLAIESAIKGRGELSAEFVAMVIDAYGGPSKFYDHFYVSALSPLGFIRESKNINFYDDTTFLEQIIPEILQWMKTQHAFGLTTQGCLVLGTGKLRKVMDTYIQPTMGYGVVEALEHPRFIMQYRRKHLADYINNYVTTLTKLRALV